MSSLANRAGHSVHLCRRNITAVAAAGRKEAAVVVGGEEGAAGAAGRGGRGAWLTESVCLPVPEGR